MELSSRFADIVASLSELGRLARAMGQEESLVARVLEASRTDASCALAHELMALATGLDRDAERIRNDVENTLVHLQFQDRVDQILAHVETSVRALPVVLDAAAATPPLAGTVVLPDFSPLLAAIEASYSTLEERALHHGSSAQNTDELTYF